MTPPPKPRKREIPPLKAEQVARSQSMKKRGRFRELWMDDMEIIMPKIEKVKEAKKKLKEKEK